jgi:hypothetical protein
MPCLRHRVLLNFEGEAEGVRVEDVVLDIVNSVSTELKEAAKA